MRPQLFIDFGVLLFIGAIGDVAEHDCSGTVVAFGLDHDFTLTTDEGARRTRTAIVPSGCRRAVAGGDARMGVCLVDPGLVVPPTGASDRALACVRRLAENGDLAWPSFRRHLGISLRTPVRDARVEHAVAVLHDAGEGIEPVEAMAARVGLSASRLEHLFTAQVGCPIRSFRIWNRFRAAAETFREVGNITTAAHAAGFYDSAHFARAFRQSFGLPPSAVLSPDLVVYVVDEGRSLVTRDGHE